MRLAIIGGARGIGRQLVAQALEAAHDVVVRGHGGLLYDRLVQPLLLRTLYEDKDREDALIRQSDLDWTLVCPGFSSNGPGAAVYRHRMPLLTT